MGKMMLLLFPCQPEQAGGIALALSPPPLSPPDSYGSQTFLSKSDLGWFSNPESTIIQYYP